VTNALTQIVVWLNAVANTLGRVFAPISVLPGWLSATLVAVATGVGMLVMFKYTSNQRAIKTVRRNIRANLLAVKLFKDNMAVGLRAQINILVNAFRLLVFALVPMLVMFVPMCLLLGQLALWYQARPLRAGEETVVTVKLNGDAGSSTGAVELMPNDAIEGITGPVRIASQYEVCWALKPRTDGYHRLAFQIDGHVVEKELACGDGFMRVSARRPEWDWSQILLHPRETPFPPGAPIQSIEIEYPERSSWINGTDWWIAYWFVVSLAAGFCFRRALKVNL
jgi:uncharacterized membrane protein (DUF106 family)